MHKAYFYYVAVFHYDESRTINIFLITKATYKRITLQIKKKLKLCGFTLRTRLHSRKRVFMSHRQLRVPDHSCNYKICH